MFQFSVRDIAFVTVIIAIGVGWWIDHAEYAKSVSRCQREWRKCVIDLAQKLAIASRQRVEISTPDGQKLNFLSDIDQLEK